MRVTLITTAALLAIVAAGCDAPAPRSILPARCAVIDGAHPFSLSIQPAASGMVRIAVEPAGIALIASVQRPGAEPVRTTSPVDRLGLMTLLVPARNSETLEVRIESRDSPEIRAEACVSAQIIPRSNTKRSRAERAFAGAGAATVAREWQRAFDGYETAARDFARQGLGALEASARHAMAELAYMRLHREQEALALAAAAREADPGRQDAAIRGTLAALEARAAVEIRDTSAEGERQAVQRTIDTARAQLSRSPVGIREALRLSIVEGFLAYQANDAQHARSLFAEAMTKCRELGDWECHAAAAQNIALLAEAEESYAVALSTYDEARRNLAPHVAPELEADILDNLGRLQRVSGLVGESDVSLAAALRIYTRLADCDGARRTLARLGSLHAQVGSVEDAVDELHAAVSLECRDLFDTLQSSRASLAGATQSRPRACAALLDPDGLSPDGRLAVMQAVLALKVALLMAEDLEGAQRCVDQAHRYAATSRGQLRTANARGELLLERGKPEQARDAFMEAQRVADEAELPAGYEHRGRTMLGLARASLAASDASSAERMALAALQVSSARADVEQVIESLLLIAAASRSAGRNDVASRALQVATTLIESVPIDELDGELRATYLAAQQAAFSELMQLLASSARDQPAVWEAFAMAERGRARSFKYALGQADDRRESASSSIDHRALLKRVSAATRNTSAEAAAELMHRLDSFQSPSVMPEATQQLLRRRLAALDAVLVQYAAGPDVMFAFVISGGRLRVIELGEREAVAHAATRLAEQLRRRDADRGKTRALARDLAAQIWWPLADLVTGRRVIVAADDALHLVPFALLPWSEEHDGDPVVQRIEVVMVPSALFLASPPQRTDSGAAGARLTLLGDPVFRRAQWQKECDSIADTAADSPASGEWTEWLPRLPASREEILAISALVRRSRPRSQVDMLLGCAATAGAMRRAAAIDSSVLHIATHGRIDARRPRLSALAVTPEADRPHDASFSLLEILSLDLHARLVTLSACETSQGRLLAGEGVLGPAQAFLQAGASSVIASYWRVDDVATAQFMQELYARLLEGNMSASEALRSTQAHEQTRSGSYSWAAFALYGWPDTRI